MAFAVTDDNITVNSVGATSLASLSDARSTSTSLALGQGTPTAPGTSDVVVGSNALNRYSGAVAAVSGNNVAVGGGVLQNATAGLRNVVVGSGAMGREAVGLASDNVVVGNNAALGLKDGFRNVAVGGSVGPANVSTSSNATDNVLVGFQTGSSLTTGSSNTLVGSKTASTAVGATQNTAAGSEALSAITDGMKNVCIGFQAGNAITTGSRNAIIGSYAGTATLSDSLVLADGGGVVRARWDAGSKNGILTVSATVPTLTDDGTMSSYYNADTQGMNILLRMSGSTYKVELSNERPINTTEISGAVALSASHRNRFSVITGAATITLGAYSGVVTGAEHEFMNKSTNTVSFAPAAGITILSIANRLNLTSYGAVVAKYLGTNTFLLCGSLE